MSKKYVQISVFCMLIVIFACKPKTDLYLERGLDILSNKKEVNFSLYQDITINEIGVIRDQKEGKKTLVLKLDDMTTQEAFNNDNIIGIRVWIVDENKVKRNEDWDFKPKLTTVKNYKYILQEIKIKEDQVQKIKIYMYIKEDSIKQKIGASLLLNKLNTYND
jgi:hypothetical protein